MVRGSDEGSDPFFVCATGLLKTAIFSTFTRLN